MDRHEKARGVFNVDVGLLLWQGIRYGGHAKQNIATSVKEGQVQNCPRFTSLKILQVKMLYQILILENCQFYLNFPR